MVTTEIKYNNQIITINHHNDHIGRVISNNKKFYEHSMLNYIDKNIPKRGTYIDVGANIGNHTVFFAKYCAEHVISIEPVKENYSILESNLKKNVLNNVEIIKHGISKDGRNFGVYKKSDNMGMCNLIEGRSDIKTITVSDLKINNLTLLKIDCEAMSMEILRAFVPIINKYKPHLFIEATNEELNAIKNIISYGSVKKFNATPTYHMKFNK